MTTQIEDRPAPQGSSVLVLTGEANRAFRSTTRTIVGILREGQLGERCRELDARKPIGSVALEAIADQPDRPIKDGEEGLVEELALAPPALPEVQVRVLVTVDMDVARELYGRIMAGEEMVTNYARAHWI